MSDSIHEQSNSKAEAIYSLVEQNDDIESQANTHNPLLSNSDRKREFFQNNIVLKHLPVIFYFSLWYILNIAYNIENKKVLNKIPAPLTVGAIQFFVGSLYTIILWVSRLRPTPSLSPTGKKAIAQLGLFHVSGQLFVMVSIGAASVSFTHTVKALEPLFSALVSAFIFKKWMHWKVYLTLIPVVGGVGYACMNENSFSWIAFYAAMGSNLAFALRAVISKNTMNNDLDNGTHLTSTNIFGLVTICATIMSVPIAIMGDGRQFKQLWDQILQNEEARFSSMDVLREIFTSGLLHYLNNEVMYLALSNVHPVTLAVGNTMKRVFIIVASIIVFRNQVSLQSIIGATVGISGVLLYSLTKQYFEKLENQEKNANIVQKL